MDLKIDIINGAYSRMRVSGLTKQPGPEDLDLALRRLEQMAAMFRKKSICVGYKFESSPNVNSPSGVPLEHQGAFELSLGDKLFADFGKTPKDPVKWDENLRGEMSTLISATAPRRQTQYPNRMPRGKSTRLRWGPLNRFYHPETRPAPGCETTKMLVGDVNDFVEPFIAYLNSGELITSFETDIDSGLTLVSSSISAAENSIEYRIRADKSSESGQFRSLSIAITTSDTRVKKRIIDFDIAEIRDDA